MSVLESAAQEFARAAVQAPPLHQLGSSPFAGPEDIQTTETAKLSVDWAWAGHAQED